MKRDAQFVRTIEVPYQRVRDQLRDDPASLFGTADEPIHISLVARVRGTEISRDITVDVIGYDEPDAEAVGAHLMFSADASHHPDRFPHLEARLDAIPVTDGRTAVFVSATYKPPLGVVGGALNTAVLHRFAEQSLEDLFERIIGELES